MVVLIVLMMATVALYVVDIILNNTPPSENLFKALAVIFASAAALVRLLANKGRRRLEFYESQYSEYIEGAFADAPLHRKKLLCAIRLYNEDNYNKALKYLLQLKPVCKGREDWYAVGLFTGLVLTDVGLKKDAVIVYDTLIGMNITSSTIYGNLGNLYSSMGHYDDAISTLRLAIQNDEKNPAPYNNLANLYFDTYDFENAKRYALQALDVNHKFRQSASLLAIIYSLENDKENAEKYFHIAISSGENPAKLQQTINRYRAELTRDNNSSNLDTDDV